MPRGSGGKLDRRVVRAAEAALAERRFVTAIDVLVGLGWLEPRRVDEWGQSEACLLIGGDAGWLTSAGNAASW